MSSLHIPASKDTLFMRGFNYRQDIDQIREFFASKCGRNTVEFFKEDGKDQLFLALKFESKDVAREVLERFNETDVLGDRISMSWYKDLRRARPYNDYRRQPYRVGYGDSYDHRDRVGYQGRSSYQRQGGRYRTASNGGRTRRYSRSISKSRSGSESGSLSHSRSKSSSCSRDSREIKKKRRDQSDSGSNRRRTIKKRHLTTTTSKESELQHDIQQFEGRNPRGPRSPPPLKSSVPLVDGSENTTSISPQRKERSKQALQSKIITATLELEQQQQQQQQTSVDNQSIDVDGDDFSYEVSPKQQPSKQSGKGMKSSVQKRASVGDNVNSADNIINSNMSKKSNDADEKQTSDWIPVTSNVQDNNSNNLNSSLTRRQQLQQQLQLVLNREQQQQQQQQQLSTTTTSATPITTSTAGSNSAAKQGDSMGTVSYDIGSYYKKYSNVYKKHEADNDHSQDVSTTNKTDANNIVINNNVVTSQQQSQHSKQQNMKGEIVNSSSGVMKDIQNTNDVYDKNRIRQAKDYDNINDDDIADVSLDSNQANKMARQAKKRKYNVQNKDKFITADTKMNVRDEEDEDDDDGGAIENDYSDGDKHSYSRYDGDEPKSKKMSRRQDERKQHQKRDYAGDYQMEKMNGTHPGKLSLLGLSHEKMLLIKDKKEEVEKAYRQDCETFATVTKLLISKDPLLEERIQKSLRENLRDIGHRCVQELREFVDRIKNNDVEDVEDMIGHGARDIADF